MECFLCSKIAGRLPDQGLAYHLYCENCGEYKITEQARVELEFGRKDIRYILSSQTFEKYYYEQEPLTIVADHIKEAKDISHLEKLFKLSKYLYHETTKRGAESKTDGISYSQVYCKNEDEYFNLLETLKSMGIIEVERFDSPSAAKGVFRSLYDYPKLLGTTMLAFEERINNIKDFKEVFMVSKKDENQITTNIYGGHNQINNAMNEGKIKAIQNNFLDIAKLNTLVENVVKALPSDISAEERNEAMENLEFIKAEAQKPAPKKTVIKTVLSALKGIGATTGFLAALTQLSEYLQNL